MAVRAPTCQLRELFDYARPPAPLFRKASVSAALEARVRERVSRFCADRDLQPALVVLAAFATLVARTLNAGGIRLGIAADDAAEAMAVEIDFSDRPAVADVIADCQRSLHQRLPFSADGLDAVLLFVAAGLRIQPARAGVASRRLFAESDCVMCFDDSQDPWRLEARFDPALFDADRVAILIQSLQVLLEGLVRNPDARVDRLDVLGLDLRYRVTQEWNGTRSDYPPDTVAGRFECVVAERPDTVAVVCGDVQLTYAAVDRDAERIAGLLQDSGVEACDFCGVLLERSPELVASMVGIAKAGAVFVPLDPADPAERLRPIVRALGVKVCLTSGTQADCATALELPIVRIDSRSEPRQRPNRAAQWRATLDDPAYINLTSGSTGTPKAVLVPHRGIMRLLFGQRYAELGPDTVWMHASAVAFDGTILEVWSALLHGARCVVYAGRIGAPADLGDAIRRFQVNTLWLTASVFNAMVELRAESLRGVRQLMTGGEALSHDHVRLAFDVLPRTILYNGYGPTESAVLTTCARLAPDLVHPRRPVPIGRAIANTAVYVLDERLEPAAPGVTGQIFIAGDGLAIGYWNNQAATADRFVPNPFAATPGARMYKSGDLARWRPDGTLEFRGRVDNQVKIHGYRIEPGEIEAVLRQHPDVHEAVVTTSADEGDGRRLVAHVVGRASTTSQEQLRRYVRTRLPDYMVPASIAIVDELPLTSTGKVDRQRLVERRPAERQTRPPATALERAVADVWKDLLATDEVGALDDFFDVGGNSLLVFRLMDRLQTLFRIRFAPQELLRARTIAEQCAVIAHVEPEPGQSERIARVLNTARSMSDEEARDALARGERRGA